MKLAILLSLVASLCTATSSVCQRLGAQHLQTQHLQTQNLQTQHLQTQHLQTQHLQTQHLEIQHAERDGSAQVHGFDPWLVFRLARQPAWLLGFGCMIAGFAFQVSALHFGPLALVQPILTVELLFVFGYLALRSRNQRARWREWGAAVAMCAGISVFLRAAAPSGGRENAPALSWWLSGVFTLAAVTAAVAAVRRGSPARRATGLGIATGIAWGFVAAVIKELSARISAGPAAIFGNWPVYVLMAAGAAAMLLTSHAMAAGPLAASQPGFTIGDPVVAILLGVFLFRERLGTSPSALAAEVVGLIVLALGVWTLSGSRLITGAPDVPPAPKGGEGTSRELTRRSR